MELYKFIDKYKIKKYKGEYVHFRGNIYTNPKEDVLKGAGYKELDETEPPSYNTETEYLERTYKSEGKIKVIYTVKKLEGVE